MKNFEELSKLVSSYHLDLSEHTIEGLSYILEVYRKKNGSFFCLISRFCNLIVGDSESRKFINKDLLCRELMDEHHHNEFKTEKDAMDSALHSISNDLNL